MLLKNVIDVCIGYFTAVLRERLLHVSLCDLAGVVNVKLVEYGLQSLFREVLRYINRCCDELTVVDSFVFGEVKLPDNVIDFFLTEVHV